MFIKIFIVLCASLLSGTPSYGFFNFMPLDIENSNALPFLNTLETKKIALKKIETDLALLKQQNPDRERATEAQINAINKTIDAAKKRLLFVRTEAEQEYLLKKITSLNERKQNLALSQEFFRENEAIFEKHLIVLKEIIDYNDLSKKKSSKMFYSWQDLRDAQTQSTETATKLDIERKKKNDLLKQKTGELETLTSLQKRIEVKNKEQKKSISVAQGPDKNVYDRKFALTNDLLDEEIDALKEQVDYSELVIKKIDQEIALKDDELGLLEQRLEEQKNDLVIMEKRLQLSINDVEIAKAEAAIENQKAARTKDTLSKKIELKKIDKEKLIIERTVLQKNLKELESTTKHDLIACHSLKSDLNYLNTHYLLLDREIDLLYAKNLLAKVPVQNKEILYTMVDLRYRLINGKEDLEDLIGTYKNQKDCITNNLKRLKDKRNEVMDSLVEISREIEEIKIKEVKILQRRDSIFRNEEEAVAKILANIEQSKRYLAERLVFSQEFLAINAELITSDEKIIGQYDLILKHLDSKKASGGVWKRSDLAISVKEFTQSLLEAENFFIELFWDTTIYLGPSIVFNKFKENSINNIFMILLCAIFFSLFYALSKFIMQLSIRIMRKRYGKKNEATVSLYTILWTSFLEFLLEHRNLVIPWLFVYLHIIAHFLWLFCTMRFIGSRYTVAMFYIASTPIFLYLSTQLLIRLQELNKRLSFLFFAEKFQERFLLLISSVCYSSAIFLPIRSAFLTYHSMQESTFANVLMAAYSLTLAMVLLLFFSKDDVQKLIPSRPLFFAFIKRQVHLHYYPVFFFIMGLLILSNPYIGYSNLAWFLAFAVPFTIAIFYGSFLVHYYVRKYAVFIFMKEDDEEISDKFEYAKTYYGFFIILTFTTLLLFAFMLTARIWGFNYMPSDVWKFLSEYWVLPIGHNKLGFVQLFELILFIICGFLVSSLLYRFVLNKIFEILRIEPGSQNTISKIFHYAIVSLSIVLGFVFIHLGDVLWYIGTLLAVGLGLALKDVLTDYVCGFFILIERPIEIGNFIRLDNNSELQGTVHKIDARTTTIMTRLNHSLIISNKELMAKPITNWGKGRFAVGFEIQIVVDYRSNVDEVKRTILEVIQNNPVILRVPNIIIRLENFEESALHFLCRAFISSRRVQEQWTIASQLREDIFKAFNAKNIAFGFPQTVVHIDNFDSKKRDRSTYRLIINNP